MFFRQIRGVFLILFSTFLLSAADTQAAAGEAGDSVDFTEGAALRLEAGPNKP